MFVSDRDVVPEVFFTNESKSYDTFAMVVTYFMPDIGSFAVNYQRREYSLRFYFVSQRGCICGYVFRREMLMVDYLIRKFEIVCEN